MKKRLSFISLVIFFLTACSSTHPAVGYEPTVSEKQVTSLTQTSYPTYTPFPPTLMPTVSSTSLPIVAMDCPVTTAGALLLKDEDNGFCLSYPEGNGVVTPPVGGEVCLVPGEPPYMECNGASLIINVEGAEGRTVDQVADAVAVDMNCSDERSNLTIANEKAVVLSECKGQDTYRKVFIIHADRLYTLTFIDLSERFYAQVITSFGFLR